MRIAGDDDAGAAVAGGGAAGLAGAGAMATGTIVAGVVVAKEVVAEEVVAVEGVAEDGATVAGMDCDIEVVAASATCALESAEATSITDVPAPQPANMKTTTAVTQQRAESVFSWRVIEAADIRFASGTP